MSTDKQPAFEKPRRTIADVNLLGTTQMHLRNPYVIALWSAMFPGAGHMLLSRYIRAIILFLWEIFINLMAHVNLALLYSLLGEFRAAKDVVDIRWSLLYIPTYLFAIWDSYRAAVDMNKQYLLASRENAPVSPFIMKPLGISYLIKTKPVIASSWCALSPGVGQIMLQRVLHGIFIMVWWIIVVYYSNLLTAIHLTFFGEFGQACAALNMQWFLNLPSLFFLCVYTSYVNTVEGNKLFDREQAQFLSRNYQSGGFPFPGRGLDESGAGMYLVAVFRQSIEVELALTALEENGIRNGDILAVPVEETLCQPRLFDTMHSYTGDSVLDLPMLLGALTTLFGCIYGFRLDWGPVLCGIIAGMIGFGLGLLIKVFMRRKKKTAACENEVVVFVACLAEKQERITRVLRDNGALGVSPVTPQG